MLRAGPSGADESMAPFPTSLDWVQWPDWLLAFPDEQRSVTGGARRGGDVHNTLRGQFLP